jgi:hypothetical protein
MTAIAWLSAEKVSELKKNIVASKRAADGGVLLEKA